MKNPLCKQLCGIFPNICLFFTNGFVLGLQSVIVPSLRSTSLKLNVDQESWLPSISILMMFLGDAICGPLSDVFGRKRMVMVSLVPQIITCILLYLAEDYNAFFVAFLISGFWGAGFKVGPMQIAEATSPKYRGSFLNSNVAALHMGLASAHFLEHFLHWRTLTLCGVLPNVIGFIVATMVPESPAWLASKGLFNECKAAFVWYRGNKDREELDKLIEQQNYALDSKYNGKKPDCFKSIFNFLCYPGFLKATVLCAISYTFIEMCGKQIFMAYAFDMIGSVVSDKNHIFYYALGLDLADVFSLYTSCFLVNKYRRRFLIFCVGAPALILLLVITTLSFLFSKNYLPDRYSFVIIILFAIYFVMLSLAVIPNLFAVVCEIYPLSHRAIGATLSGFIFVLITFSVTKIAPSIMIMSDIYVMFIINLVVSSLALLYLFFYLPETSNKTLQDIEEEMNGNSQRVMLEQIEITQKMLD